MLVCRSVDVFLFVWWHLNLRLRRPKSSRPRCAINSNLETSLEVHTSKGKSILPWPIPSMGLGYLPIHEWLIFMVNVGIYTVRPMDAMGDELFLRWHHCPETSPKLHTYEHLRWRKILFWNSPRRWVCKQQILNFPTFCLLVFTRFSGGTSWFMLMVRQPSFNFPRRIPSQSHGSTREITLHFGTQEDTSHRHTRSLVTHVCRPPSQIE